MLTSIYQYSMTFFGTKRNSSIICFLSSGDMYHFLGAAVSTSSSVSLFCEVFGDFFFERLVILSAILSSVKSPVASAVFWIALFKEVFIASVVDCLALSRSFLTY